MTLAVLAWVASGHGGTEEPGPKDTLELSAKKIAKNPSAYPAAAKSEIVLSDEDRLVGNLGDVLERLPGIHVVRTGGIGDYLGVSVWGSSERQVNVYVNGILQNQATDPSLFLSDWDLSRVEKIEVYKGLAPDNLPGAPMGGSINIVTRENAQGTSAQGSAGAGSFGSLRVNGSSDYREHDWGLHGQIARDQSDGNFTFYDDNGTEFQPGRNPNGVQRLGEGDLVKKTRHNNAHGFSELDGSWIFNPKPEAEIGIQADASRLHKQIPTPFANLDTSTDISTFRESDKYSFRTYCQWSRPSYSLALDLSGQYLGEIYVDTSNTVGAIGLGYNDDAHRYTDLLGSLSSNINVTQGFTISSLVSYGVSGYLYTDRHTDHVYPWIYRYTGEGKLSPAFVSGRHSWQVVLSSTLHLQEYYGAEQYAYAGVRVPREDWGRQWAARAGYQYKPWDWFWIFTQAGNSYRIPTFFEQFGDRGTIMANPALRSEAGFNSSSGLHAQGDRFSLDLQTFATEGRRIITLVPNSQSVLIYSNTGDTRILGIETDLAAHTRPWSRSELDFTLQKALNLSGGSSVDDYKLIPYRPLTQGTFRQTFVKGGWTFAASAYYQGLAYPNASNSPSLFDSYSHNTEWQTRCDFTLSWRRNKLLAAAGMNNAFDQRNFDFFNFPLPGRSLFAALQLTL